MEFGKIMNCHFCFMSYPYKDGKLYCSRECKGKAKDKRERERLHELGIVTPIEKIIKNKNREDPTKLYKNYEATKIAARRHYMMKTFGLTLEQVAELKAKQKCCDICGTTIPRGRDNQWHLDHIKGTKIIRGLLCNNCNLGIGFLRHDVEIFEKAIKYLKKFC